MRRTIPILLAAFLLGLLASPPAAAHIEQCEDFNTGFKDSCELGYVLNINDLVDSADTGAWIVVLGTLLFVVPFVVLLAYLGWLLLPKRLITVDSKEKIAEVDPGSSKTYTVLVENRLRSRPLDVEFQVGTPPAGWSAALKIQKPHPSGFVEVLTDGGNPHVLLAPKKAGVGPTEALVTITAAPSASAEEWSELEFLAIPHRKGAPQPKKAREVQLITLIKERGSTVSIEGVTHDPDDFQPGDAVTTTVRVKNAGSEPAQGASVRLYVNDQEAGVRSVPLPAGGETSVTIGWTAVEGENRIRVSLAS